MVLKVTLLAVGQVSSADFSRESAGSLLHMSKSALGFHIIRFDVQVLTSLEGEAKLGSSGVNNVDMSIVAEVTADVAVHLVFGLDADGFFIDADGSGDPEFTINNLRITGTEGSGILARLTSACKCSPSPLPLTTLLPW